MFQSLENSSFLSSSRSLNQGWKTSKLSTALFRVDYLWDFNPGNQHWKLNVSELRKMNSSFLKKILLFWKMNSPFLKNEFFISEQFAFSESGWKTSKLSTALFRVDYLWDFNREISAESSMFQSLENSSFLSSSRSLNQGWKTSKLSTALFRVDYLQAWRKSALKAQCFRA